MINNKIKTNLYIIIISFIILLFSMIYIHSESNMILYYKLETTYNTSPDITQLPSDKTKDNYQENTKQTVDFYVSENKIRLNTKELSDNQIVTDASVILEDNNNNILFYIIDNIQKYYAVINQENMNTFLQDQNKINEIINSSTIKKEGTEKIGNLTTDKYSIYYQNKKILELYVVDYKELIPTNYQNNFKKLYLESKIFNKFNSYFNELGNKITTKISSGYIPIKYNLFENNKLTGTTLLKEIKFIEYNKSYFEIPSDYKKVDFK
ncbi:MAG: hypothetical protein N2485_06425 [bacterium]|nr:hypothetical protein [bacterium]